MAKFLITGVSLRSKGGVAMVLESLNLLGKQHNYALISHYLDDDEAVTRENKADIKLIPAKPSVHQSVNAYKLEILKMIFDLVTFAFFRFSQYATEVSKRDAVLQVHGISFSEQFGLNDTLTTFLKVSIAKLLRKKFIAMPQSYGPNRNKVQRFFAKKALNMMDAVMPRGKVSVDFVKKLAPESKYEFVPDLAFNYRNPGIDEIDEVKKKFNLSDQKKYVALIPNVLFIKWQKEKVIKHYQSLIEKLSLKGYSFIFISHEYDDVHIDDRYFCKEIIKGLRNIDYFFTDQKLTALEIKSLLSLCEFSICSRFHGMISSLTMGVTPYVIGWSNKYYEIMDLFGLKNNVQDYKEFDLEQFLEIINDSNIEESKKIISTKVDYLSDLLNRKIKMVVKVHD